MVWLLNAAVLTLQLIHQPSLKKNMFKRIGLIASKRTDEGITETIKLVTQLLQKRGIEILFCKDCADFPADDSVENQTIPEFGSGLDLVIAIGGDGTMLRAAHLTRNSIVPLLGINRGHLGFLADIPAENISVHLGAILDGDYLEEERFMLHSELLRGDERIITGGAFNDIIIQKWNTARLVEFDTYINDNFLLTQRSDGMIVSTPTGSTAYALAGGGPIVNPTLDALLLVPICPHTLSIRPIVLDGDSKVEIIVGKRSIDQARLTCDGDVVNELQPGDKIHIRKAEQTVRLIHPADHDHFSILRAKLNWGR